MSRRRLHMLVPFVFSPPLVFHLGLVGRLATPPMLGISLSLEVCDVLFHVLYKYTQVYIQLHTHLYRPLDVYSWEPAYVRSS